MSIGLIGLRNTSQTRLRIVAVPRGWTQYLRRSGSHSSLQTIMSSTNRATVSSKPDTTSYAENYTRGGWRGRGRGRGRAVANAVFEQSVGGASLATEGSVQGVSTRLRGRGHGQVRGRGGRGGKGGANQPRPTHFLALPLHTHEPLRSLVSSFQSALLSHDPPIVGLDKSIVIDSRRLHLTLGVMALEEEEGGLASSQGDATAVADRATSSTATSAKPSFAGPHTADATPPKAPKRTVKSALALLTSLQPQISAVLSGSRVKVPLEHMDVFPPGATSNASVLFLGPKEKGGADWDRLWDVANLIHNTFKSHGYITETRPLKLHCTILNVSHRKPRFPRKGFSFEGILRAEGATQLLGATNSSAYLTLPEPEREVPNAAASGKMAGSENTELAFESLSIAAIEGVKPMPGAKAAAVVEATSSSTQTIKLDRPEPSQEKRKNKWPKSSPVPVKAGTYDVATVELWVMGSHGENNEYVSLGGIKLE